MSTDSERQAVIDDMKRLLRDTLQIGPRSHQLTEQSPLLGHIPELDSMAVVAVLTAIEERFGFVIDDSEISADTFATLGSLTDFVLLKIAA